MGKSRENRRRRRAAMEAFQPSKIQLRIPEPQLPTEIIDASPTAEHFEPFGKLPPRQPLLSIDLETFDPKNDAVTLRTSDREIIVLKADSQLYASILLSLRNRRRR